FLEMGEKTYVFSKDKSGTNRMQYQQLMLTRGFESSSETRLHFGMDSTVIADSVLVVWPNQRYQLLKSIKTDTLIIANQKNADNLFEYDHYFKPTAPLF